MLWLASLIHLPKLQVSRKDFFIDQYGHQNPRAVTDDIHWVEGCTQYFHSEELADLCQAGDTILIQRQQEISPKRQDQV